MPLYVYHYVYALPTNVYYVGVVNMYIEPVNIFYISNLNPLIIETNNFNSNFLRKCQPKL